MSDYIFVSTNFRHSDLRFWLIYLSEIFWRYSHDGCTPVPRHYKFLVCLSLCFLAYNLIEIRPIVINQVKMNEVLYMSVSMFDGFLPFDNRPTY